MEEIGLLSNVSSSSVFKESFIFSIIGSITGIFSLVSTVAEVSRIGFFDLFRFDYFLKTYNYFSTVTSSLHLKGYTGVSLLKLPFFALWFSLVKLMAVPLESNIKMLLSSIRFKFIFLFSSILFIFLFTFRLRLFQFILSYFLII